LSTRKEYLPFGKPVSRPDVVVVGIVLRKKVESGQRYLPIGITGY